jgi:GNAT superfamily N-acetyltransferase
MTGAVETPASIRRAHAEDAPSIHGLFGFVDEREYFPETPLSEIQQSFVDGDVWYVAEENTAIIGAVCAYAERLDDGSGRIGQLCVENGRRRSPQRYGHQLMNTAEAWMRAQGCGAVTVGVLDFKPAWLRRFYEQLGYRFVQRIPSWGIQPAPLRPCDLDVFQKSLDATA